MLLNRSRGRVYIPHAIRYRHTNHAFTSNYDHGILYASHTSPTARPSPPSPVPTQPLTTWATAVFTSQPASMIAVVKTGWQSRTTVRTCFSRAQGRVQNITRVQKRAGDTHPVGRNRPPCLPGRSARPMRGRACPRRGARAHARRAGVRAVSPLARADAPEAARRCRASRLKGRRGGIV